MLHNLTGWHALIVLAIVLLLFGATKLPALAKSMGQSVRAFRGEMRDMKEDEPAVPAAAAWEPVPVSGSTAPTVEHGRSAA